LTAKGHSKHQLTEKPGIWGLMPSCLQSCCFVVIILEALSKVLGFFVFNKQRSKYSSFLAGEIFPWSLSMFCFYSRANQEVVK
jgi:hypothetical protein